MGYNQFFMFKKGVHPKIKSASSILFTKLNFSKPFKNILPSSLVSSKI